MIGAESAERPNFPLADAGGMEREKTCATYYVGEGKDAYSQSAIFEGVRFTDFLAAVGAPDAESVTIIDTDGKERAVSRALLSDEKTVLAWIMNKALSVADSDSRVAFASEKGKPEDYIPSVAKIIIK